MTGSPVTVRHEAATKRRRLLRSLSAFTVAAVAGVSLLGIRWAMRGDADPFNAGWPLYLQMVLWR